MIKASALAREEIAAEVDLEKFELPGVKLVSISKDAEVLIKISKDVKFPADLLQAVNSSNQSAEKDRSSN